MTQEEQKPGGTANTKQSFINRLLTGAISNVTLSANAKKDIAKAGIVLVGGIAVSMYLLLRKK
jgi:hypothetical protein